MQRLFVLIVVVTAVRGFSSHVNVDHVHDHDYPYGLGLTAPPEPAARETAVGSTELRVSADANDLRMDDLQAQLDQLQAQLDQTSTETVTIWPWLSFIYLRLGECHNGPVSLLSSVTTAPCRVVINVVSFYVRAQITEITKHIVIIRCRIGAAS